MKNRNIIIIIIITVIIIIIVIFSAKLVLSSKGWQYSLVAPLFRVKPLPTLSPTPKVKQFKFDASTDLEKELESVSPEILESDFENL